MIWLALPAAAHPFADSFYGHDLGVAIAEDHVTIDYVASLPMQDLVREVREIERSGGSADDYIESQPRELRSGLLITLDGARPAGLVDTPVVQPDSTARAMVVAMRLEFDLDPRRAHSLRISNGNRPEVPTYFCTTATVARSWLVPSTSLVGDQIWNGQWRMDEPAREITIDLAPRGALAAIGRFTGRDPWGARPIEAAAGDGGLRELLHGWLPFALAGLVAVGFVVYRLRER